MQVHSHRVALMRAALAAASHGWCVFPVLPNGKRPALRNWEGRTTTETERIRRCWSTGSYNVGIATGRSNLVVVDLDVPKLGQHAPVEWRQDSVTCGQDVLGMLAERDGASYAQTLDTYAVHTASGGLHLYYQSPRNAELRNTAGRLGWLVDTRAAGGYVIAEGSRVDGAEYRGLSDRTPAPLPAWLERRLIEHPMPPLIAPQLADPQRRHRYASAALRAEVHRVLIAREGTRNDTLVRAAFALGQLVGAGLLPAMVVTETLMAAGQVAGLGARECRATIQSGLRSGTRRPRGGVA